MRTGCAPLRTLLVSAFLLLAATGRAEAELITVISTGYDNATGMRLPEGALDTRFVIAPGGTGGHYGEVPFARMSPLPGGWLSDAASLGSRWLALRGGGLEGITVEPGSYFFDMRVDLTGFDPATALIRGLRYAADNKLLAVVINGVDVFRQPSGFAEEFRAFRDLGDRGLGLFRDGINTIRFEVENSPPGTSPLGLRVEGRIEGDVIPEPATLTLLSCGTVALLGYGRWRRRRVC